MYNNIDILFVLFFTRAGPPNSIFFESKNKPICILTLFDYIVPVFLIYIFATAVFNENPIILIEFVVCLSIDLKRIEFQILFVFEVEH